MADLKITFEEHVALIEESVGGKYTACTFGASGVFLKDIPDNVWAKKRVEEVRAGESTKQCQPKF